MTSELINSPRRIKAIQNFLCLGFSPDDLLSGRLGIKYSSDEVFFAINQLQRQPKVNEEKQTRINDEN